MTDWRGAGSAITTFSYDDANRLVGKTLPSGATSAWAYDAADRLTSLTHRTSAGGSAFGMFSFTYDKAGRRLTQTDDDPARSPSQTTQSFEHDPLGRLLRETPRAAVSATPVVYGYDAAGNRTSTGVGTGLLDNDASAISYSGTAWTLVADTNATTNQYRRTTSANDSADIVFTGTALSLVYATATNGGKVRVTLDPGGASPTVLGEISQCANSPTWQQWKTFSGLADGTHTIRLTTLASTCNGAAAGSWNLDAVEPYSQTKSYEYDPDSRLTQIDTSGTLTAFEYDPAGSVTKKTVGATTTTYTWDGAKRLTGVSQNGTSQATFGYDGDGRRTSKTTPSATTSYRNDPRGLTQVLQETTGSTTLSYIPGLAQYDPSKPADDDKWAYFHGDGQHNRFLTNNAAAVSLRQEYDPFGGWRVYSGAGDTDFGYGGEQHDFETGLVNLRARYYDPALGRFLSRDPMAGLDGRPLSWNRYSYVENDPLNATDPTGYGKKDRRKAQKEAKACRNPGQYTGSCKGGPPNKEYDDHGERDAALKEAGRRAAQQAQERGLEEQEAQQQDDNSVPGLPGLEVLLPVGGSEPGFTESDSPTTTDVPAEDDSLVYGYRLDVRQGCGDHGKGAQTKMLHQQTPCFGGAGSLNNAAIGPASTTGTRWARPETLLDHYARHGADFGARSPNEYARMADNFFDKAQNMRLQTKLDPRDGTIRVYDPGSNTFGSYNADGTTRTFYKPPGGQAYFDRQPGYDPSLGP